MVRTIESLLTYAKCPMKLFFSEQMGIHEYDATFRGSVNYALRGACRSFLDMCAGGRSSNIKRDAAGNLAQSLRRIPRPSDVRGGGKKRLSYEQMINNATATFEQFMDEMIAKECTIIGSPYIYELSLNGISHVGTIDAILNVKDVIHIVTYDFSVNAPSEDILAYGLVPTVSSYAYRLITNEASFKNIHYWVPGNMYLEVTRMDGQYLNVMRELEVLATLVKDCFENDRWYRGKGYWCNNCHLRLPCNEISCAGVGMR